MTREEIEKAAFYSIDAPCVRDCDKCNDKYKNDCMWSIYRGGFVDGADWRIRAVWHDMTVMPDMNKLPILLEHNTGPIHFVDDRFSVWNYLKKHYKRWAYVKDLMPIE